MISTFDAKKQRKVYHKNGWLVQYLIGKKWVDIRGAANSIQTIITMGGNPDNWDMDFCGYYIDVANKRRKKK